MRNSKLNSCRNCCLKLSTKRENVFYCQMIQQEVSDEDFCSKFKNSIEKCDYCGKPCYPAPILDETSGKLLCPQCFQKLGTCSTCSLSVGCDFESNPIDLPKQVQQQVKKGNMVMTTMGKNPARIKETCEKNCKCYSSSFGCLREARTCGNYQEAL